MLCHGHEAARTDHRHPRRRRFDNMFPHHENEIAQSEACSGKQFVNLWTCTPSILSWITKRCPKALATSTRFRDLLNKGYTRHPSHGTITCLRMANLIGNYKHELDKRDLLFLQGALHFRADYIAAKTDGILGFFRYLFKSSVREELQQLKKNYKLLEAFVKDILKANEKVQVKENKLVNPPPKEAEEELVVNNFGNVEEPEVTEEVPPPPVDEGLPIDEEGLPPPPPPPMPGEEKIEVFKFSDIEPDEPDLEVAKYHKRAGENEDNFKIRMQNEINVIDVYIAQVKEAMAEAVAMKNKVEELELALAEHRLMYAENQENYNILKGKIDALEKSAPDEVVILRYPIKDKKAKIIDWKLIPYYSIDQFDKNNEELKKINESPIPRSLQKETALEYFKEDFEEVKAEFLQGKIDIDNKEKELDEIKNRQLRDLGYDQILDEILKKERKIKIWINALRNRRNTLDAVEKRKRKLQKQ